MGSTSTVAQRRHVIYSGHVQGVGFRFTTHSISHGHEVVGFVRNLADGGVEVVVEGSGQEIDAFLAEVETRLSGHIHNVQSDRRPATDEFANFGIRY